MSSLLRLSSRRVVRAAPCVASSSSVVAARPAGGLLLQLQRTSTRAFGAYHVPVGPASKVDGVYRRPEVPEPTGPVRPQDRERHRQEREFAVARLLARSLTPCPCLLALPLSPSSLQLSEHDEMWWADAQAPEPVFDQYDQTDRFDALTKLTGALVLMFGGLTGVVALYGPENRQIVVRQTGRGATGIAGERHRGWWLRVGDLWFICCLARPPVSRSRASSRSTTCA